MVGVDDTSNYTADCSPDYPLRYMCSHSSSDSIRLQLVYYGFHEALLDSVLNVMDNIIVVFNILSISRCQAGDLSGKHGLLELYSDVSSRPTYTFVDPNVQLSGMYSGTYV